MIRKIVIFSFLCGVVLSDSRANQYIDFIIQTRLPPALHSAALSPAPQSDFRSTFGIQDSYGNVGETFYSKGNATNLNLVKRHGGCSGPRMDEGIASSLEFLTANQYIDKIMKRELPKALRVSGLNPGSVPDFKTLFNTNDVGNQGEVTYSKGKVNRLDKAKRLYDCSGPKFTEFEDGDYRNSINCTFSLKQLMVEFKVAVTVGDKVYRPKNTGHISEIIFGLDIVGIHQTYRAYIKNFKFTSVEPHSITPIFAGLPVSLSKHLHDLREDYKEHVSTYLTSMFKDQYLPILNHTIQNTNLDLPTNFTTGLF